MMARSKKKSNFKIALIGLVCLVLGCIAGFVGYTYLGLPETEQLIVTEAVYYSYNDDKEISYTPISTADGTVSVHFLELESVGCKSTLLIIHNCCRYRQFLFL